jgi:hypothetical protein
VKAHGGKLGSAGSFIEITGSAILSGMRDIEDGKCELRIYDLDGGSEGEITLFSPVKSAFESDFRHIKTADAVTDNGKIKYKLKSKQIKTFIVEV